MAQLLALPEAWLRQLVQQLSSDDKLQLSLASKQLAAMVAAQHAGGMRLTFRKAWLQRQQQQQQQQSILQIVLSAARDECPVHVVLDGGVSATYATFPHHRIRHLTLRGMEVNRRVLCHLLKLHACHRLCALTIEDTCSIRLPASSIIQLQQQLADWSPPTLCDLRATAVSSYMDTEGLHVLVELLAPQLTHLTWDNNFNGFTRSFVRPIQTSSLSQLTRFSTQAYLTDELFAPLAALPNLTHVTAKDCNLSSEHSNRQLASGSWQQVEMLCTCAQVSKLLRLPLKRIHTLIVHGISSTPQLPEAAAIQFVTECPGLLCVPQHTADNMQEQVFQIATAHPAIISLAVSRLATNVTTLSIVVPAAMHSVAEWLPHLPPTAIKLQLPYSWAIQHPSAEVRNQYWQLLVAVLPTSITQITATLSGIEGCLAAGCLASALSASQTHTRTVVSLSCVRELQGAAELQQLLAAHPEHVQLHMM